MARGVRLKRLQSCPIVTPQAIAWVRARRDPAAAPSVRAASVGSGGWISTDTGDDHSTFHRFRSPGGARGLSARGLEVQFCGPDDTGLADWQFEELRGEALMEFWHLALRKKAPPRNLEAGRKLNSWSG